MPSEIREGTDLPVLKARDVASPCSAPEMLFQCLSLWPPAEGVQGKCCAAARRAPSLAMPAPPLTFSLRAGEKKKKRLLLFPLFNKPMKTTTAEL